MSDVCLKGPLFDDGGISTCNHKGHDINDESLGMLTTQRSMMTNNNLDALFFSSRTRSILTLPSGLISLRMRAVMIPRPKGKKQNHIIFS